MLPLHVRATCSHPQGLLIFVFSISPTGVHLHSRVVSYTHGQLGMPMPHDRLTKFWPWVYGSQAGLNTVWDGLASRVAGTLLDALIGVLLIKYPGKVVALKGSSDKETPKSRGKSSMNWIFWSGIAPRFIVACSSMRTLLSSKEDFKIPLYPFRWVPLFTTITCQPKYFLSGSAANLVQVSTATLPPSFWCALLCHKTWCETTSN